MSTSIVKSEKIVIITGDSNFANKLDSSLKESGYSNITLVTNASDGLKSIYDILPHLVLIDVTLKEAYDILRSKQAEPLLVKIPVFLLSTQGVPIDMQGIPSGSVSEFIMAMQSDPHEVVLKIEHQFGRDPIVPPDSLATASDKINLLWVEDDKLIGTILAKKLVASGFDLFHAKNGEEALEALKSVVPDAIAVDLILPGMSGFDILEAVNKDDRIKNVPKMILSNLSKPSDIEKARSLGATKFLVKATTSLDQIVSEIKTMVGR